MFGGIASKRGLLRAAADGDAVYAVGRFRFSSPGLARANRIVQLNADGSVDTAFNIGTGFAQNVSAVALQSNGKLIVVGAFLTYNGSSVSRIVRLNTDGSLDTSFNVGTGLNNSANDVAVQSDDKIIVGGAFSAYNGATAPRLIRLNSDGTLDTSFNPGTGPGNSVNALTLQSDGKILIAGSFVDYNGTARNYIARVNSDGALDTTFDVGTGFSSITTAIGSDSTGKVIVGGLFSTFNGVSRNRIARLNSDGSLDTTFVVGTGFNNPVFTRNIAVQSDNKVICGGDFFAYNGTTANRVARLDTNGALDNTFGSGVNTSVNTVALQPDGKILISGGFESFNDQFVSRIVRCNTDGTIDTSFTAAINSAATAIAVRGNGKIIAAGGFTTVNGQRVDFLVRIKNDVRDQSLNVSGNFDNQINRLVVQPDEKLIVCGTFTTISGNSRMRVARLNADGSLDTTFNVGTGFNNTVNAAEATSDGKIIAGGAFLSYNGTSINRIARLNDDGSLDTTFNVGTGFNNTVNALAIQEDGKILVGGFFTAYNGVTANRIIRLNADGTHDTSFAIGTGLANAVNDFALTPDGKIIACGSFTTYQSVAASRIVRINADGSRDTAFNIGTGFNTTVNSCAVQSDGKIVAVGAFSTYSGAGSIRIVRINANGSRDTGFNVGTGFNSTANTVRTQPDGKVLVGGFFTGYNNTDVRYIVRLTDSGAIDNTFDFAFDNAVDRVLFVPA
jgi:uncharacterized delta-60 repeat protein